MESIGSVGSGICLRKPLISGCVRVSERCRIEGAGVNEVDVSEVTVKILSSIILITTNTMYLCLIPLTLLVQRGMGF